MLKTRPLLAAALLGISSAANADCSSGFIANVLCQSGVIDQQTARDLDRANAALGQPVDNAIYSGMDYVVPGSGTAARAWPQVRGAIPHSGGQGPAAPDGSYYPQTGAPGGAYYPRLASVCATPQITVPMMAAMAVGSPCIAYTPYGNFPGIAQ